MSYFRTAILLAVLTAIFMSIGYLLGREAGMLIAFFLALAMNLFSWWNSDKVVLRMHNAVEVDASTAPEFYDIVRQLSENTELPIPRVYVMQNPQPNAFATGRNPEHAAVAATTGLLELLSREEAAGVMAHELAHIKARDTLIMTITATVAGAISMLAQFGMFFGGNRNQNAPLGSLATLAIMIVAPLAAMLVQMSISRAREYQADALGAQICQRPLWLASALEKMAGAASRVENLSAERNPASAHLFIINPLSGARMDNLFSTHPKTEDRVARLIELARLWGQIEDEEEEAYADPSGYRDGEPWDPRSDDRGPWD